MPRNPNEIVRSRIRRQHSHRPLCTEGSGENALRCLKIRNRQTKCLDEFRVDWERFSAVNNQNSWANLCGALRSFAFIHKSQAVRQTGTYMNSGGRQGLMQHSSSRAANHPPPPPERIEWFLEGQAFSRSYDSVPCLPTTPPPPSTVSSTGDTLRNWGRETTCWRERGGGEGWARSRKLGPLYIIQNSLSPLPPATHRHSRIGILWKKRG